VSDYKLNCFAKGGAPLGSSKAGFWFNTLEVGGLLLC
jgi:hypothetical protein